MIVRKRKEAVRMKCDFCKKETTWDESFGPEDLIVCKDCFYTLCKKPLSTETALSFIFRLAKIRRNQEKTNKVV